MSTAGAVRRRSARDAALSPWDGTEPARCRPPAGAAPARPPSRSRGRYLTGVSYNLRYEKTMLRTNAHF